MGWLDYFWNEVLGRHPRLAFAGVLLLAVVFVAVANRKQSSFIFRSLSRNKLRSGLTSIAVIVLVLVVTGIWTVLGFIDRITTEKAENPKALVTERHQV